ncbi:hypothetical protein MKD41_09735 [Lutibacter sp. A64]|uniref:hypothetical protein n=1 Tax=Lutibacter sp. A64 TaxID=2918526 RepID=UPI001F058442|nr:hypothetical protein [Lutibacter sp. A64]UMB52617.1 hypothetical protein MKD41_09735 [Lutibacter sp. A64]
MENTKLPFQIGEQYENWEFELEILPDRINGYDSYKYIGNEFKFFLNYLPDETELIFNLDILECVLFVFKNRDKQFYKKVKLDLKTNYDIFCKIKGDKVFIAYGNIGLIQGSFNIFF